jgi:hypothetical protein
MFPAKLAEAAANHAAEARVETESQFFIVNFLQPTKQRYSCHAGGVATNNL